MRLNLKGFRASRNLTQKEMAERIGCSRITYSMVERSVRSGSVNGFWKPLQKAFNVSDDSMFKLMKNWGSEDDER